MFACIFLRNYFVLFYTDVFYLGDLLPLLRIFISYRATNSLLVKVSSCINYTLLVPFINIVILVIVSTMNFVSAL